MKPADFPDRDEFEAVIFSLIVGETEKEAQFADLDKLQEYVDMRYSEVGEAGTYYHIAEMVGYLKQKHAPEAANQLGHAGIMGLGKFQTGAKEVTEDRKKDFKKMTESPTGPEAPDMNAEKEGVSMADLVAKQGIKRRQ